MKNLTLARSCMQKIAPLRMLSDTNAKL